MLISILFVNMDYIGILMISYDYECSGVRLPNKRKILKINLVINIDFTDPIFIRSRAKLFFCRNNKRKSGLVF